MQKQLRTILNWLIKIFLVVIVVSGINYFVISKQLNNIKIPANTEIIKDSLVRDTLYNTRDSLTTKIIHIEKTYEEKKSDIMANDTTADMLFFTNYINNYKGAIKDN